MNSKVAGHAMRPLILRIKTKFLCFRFSLEFNYQINYNAEVLKIFNNLERERIPIADPFPKVKDSPPVVTNPTVFV